MTRADRKAKKLQEQCDEFNASTPVGSEVLVKKDNGSNVITKTRSEAQVLSGHTAVIWLDGISGCYLLDRVSKILLMFGTKVASADSFRRRNSRKLEAHLDRARRKSA